MGATEVAPRAGCTAPDGGPIGTTKMKKMGWCLAEAMFDIDREFMAKVMSLVVRDCNLTSSLGNGSGNFELWFQSDLE